MVATSQGSLPRFPAAAREDMPRRKSGLEQSTEWLINKWKVVTMRRSVQDFKPDVLGVAQVYEATRKYIKKAPRP